MLTCSEGSATKEIKHGIRHLFLKAYFNTVMQLPTIISSMNHTYMYVLYFEMKYI